ncbi:TetR/AcrR family transcriptional regulator [Tsukamurella serpentis]
MPAAPKPRPRPRVRLVNTALNLVGRHGFADAGLAELTAQSHASKNSLYQYFPGGKAELVEASTSLAGRRLLRYIDAATSKGQPNEWIGRFIELWKRVLVRSEFQVGCPLLAAALADGEPRVQDAATAAYTECERRFAAALVDYGVQEEGALVFASVFMSSIEGAVARARAARDIYPLTDVYHSMMALLEVTMARPDSVGAAVSRR